METKDITNLSFKTTKGIALKHALAAKVAIEVVLDSIAATEPTLNRLIKKELDKLVKNIKEIASPDA